MPDPIPAGAVQAALDALEAEDCNRTYFTFPEMARVAVEAAAPFLAEHIATLLVTTPKPADASWRVWVARITREAFPQPSGTLQDVRPARDGMSGCSDDPKGAASLSAPRGWRAQDANGRTLLWKIADSGDLILAPSPTPITEESTDGS